MFPIDWVANDVGDQYTIVAFGKTRDGTSVAARIAFYPYFYAQAKGAGDGELKLVIANAVARNKAVQRYCRIVERTSLWGFTGGAKIRVAQLAFPTLRKMRWAARQLREQGLTTFESGMDPLVRFYHVRDISPSQWICVDAYEAVRPDELLTRADIEVACTFDRVRASPLVERPPLVICSWDLETYSASRRFPQPENEDDAIIQIASCFVKYGEREPFRHVVFCLRETADVEGVEVRSYDDEHDMINAWIQALEDERVDVMLGYNTDQFDWRYVHGRSLICVDDMSGDPLVDVTKLGRMRTGGGVLRERELNSGAFGQNKFTTLTTPGVLNLDLLQLLRKEYKLDSYSLNNVSKHFLGDAKVDLAAWEIFDKFERGADDRALIAAYAAKDTVLPVRLFDRLCVFENLSEMSSATFVPIDYVVQRGQQIKVFSVLMRKARQMGYVCPDGVGIGVVGKYTGATVLNAERGAYMDIVSGLDFASLYPSIIRAWNLDYSTIVLDSRYDNLPGVEYYEVDTDQGTFRFAQGVPSVLPGLLADLAQFRKAAKKKMADAKARGDEFMAALHNASQLAFKITMNSAYGFIGATKGLLSCVPIAASVTATGRRMIQKTKALVEQLVPGSRVVYGDSVAGYTPVVVRTAAEGVRVTTIDSLASAWTTYGDKESAELEGVDVWSDSGWTPIQRVIRHRVTKPMVRVLTGTSVVDVTMDHSLIRCDGTPITPIDAVPGTRLLHTEFPAFYTAADVVTCVGMARDMGRAARGGDDIPPSVLGASREVRAAFWEGLCDEVGHPPSFFTQVAAAKAMMLAASLGHDVAARPVQAAWRVYRRDGSCGGDVCSVHMLPTSPRTYVYDLTTANHHFAAGVGTLVVHNTDSVMCILNLGEAKRHDMAAHFEVAAKLADDISKTFPSPVELEFEKCYFPYLLFSKKRYAGLMYTQPDRSDKIDIKGLQLVRRDSCPLVKDVGAAILDKIMYERSVEKALDEARRVVLRVLRHEEPLDKFVVSKALRGDYKNTAQPHLHVAKKILQRTGAALPTGVRVPFVFVEDAANPDGLLAERAEDPEHVRHHGLKIDTLFYIHHQLESPIVALLELLVPDPATAVFGHADIKPLMDALHAKQDADIKIAKRIRKNKANHQLEITKFFASA